MKTLRVISMFLLLSVLSATAQETPMRRLYRNIMTQPDEELLKDAENSVDEVSVRALSQAEVRSILPLAFQCVHSPKTGVSKAGFGFLISAMLRFDSAELLGSYIDELGRLSDQRDLPERGLVLLILGSLNPKPPEKAIDYLMVNLESRRTSNEEARTVAACLLRAAPADSSILHRVLLVVSNRSDAGLTDGVIRQLGLSKTRLSEGVGFISANLNEQDENLRAAAVDSASRLDKDTKVQLHSQLTRIASDPKESQETRRQAAEALKP